MKCRFNRIRRRRRQRRRPRARLRSPLRKRIRPILPMQIEIAYRFRRLLDNQNPFEHFHELSALGQAGTVLNTDGPEINAGDLLVMGPLTLHETTIRQQIFWATTALGKHTYPSEK